MSTLIIVIVSTWLAGLAMPAGALVARVRISKTEWVEKEFRHGVMAFGGGALLSAVALVLVPEGIKPHTPVAASLLFIAGGLAFMALDIILKKIDTPASQLAAMLSDFLPESMALGSAFASGNDNAFLLALMIALQNFPEGFNAYREMSQAPSFKPIKTLVIYAAMSGLGPLAGVSGFLWLADYPMIITSIMLVASGGILYSVFQDIAPQVKLENHWGPPMGAVLGFVLGMVGFMITG